jgi:L-alanine-DL-glutamate epimerase-like enolase superfamily enzyme
MKNTLSECPTEDNIDKLEVVPISLPLRNPVSFSTRRLTHRNFVITRIWTKDGIEGIGYTYGDKIVASAIEFNLARLLLGQPAGAIEFLWNLMYQDALLLGRRGAMMRAISAVDIALWDILAKRAGLPLYRILGGNSMKVPVYFSGGYYRDEMTTEYVVTEAERVVEKGHHSMKIKVGGLPLKEDLERIKITREVLGPDRRLAVDANNAWSNAAEAMLSIREMEKFKLWWIEEPLSPDDVVGHASLARDLLTPIATGEIEATRWGFQSIISERAADILQPDACVAGGVSEWIKIAHLASAFGLQVAPHWNADIHAHLAAAVSNCSVVEYFDIEEDVYNFDLILSEHLKIRNGWLEIPDRPGNGIVLDEKAIVQYQIDL